MVGREYFLVTHIYTCFLSPLYQLLEGRDVGKKEPLWKPGHAYEGKDLASQFDIKKGVDLFKKPESSEESEDEEEAPRQEEEEEGGSLDRRERKRLKKEEKKRKKEQKKEKKKKKHKHEEEEGATRGRDRREDQGKGPGASTSSDVPSKSFWGSNLAADEAPARPPPADSAAAAAADVPSWRGRLDPTKRPQPGGRGQPFRGGGSGGSMFGKAFRGGKTDTSGMGGMNRRR